MRLKHLIFLLALFLSHLSAFFSQTAGKLHTARLARLYELAGITDDSPIKSSLLLGIDSFNRVIQVKSTKTRKELGNLGIFGPTRCGKTVFLTAILDNWEYSSITNDIKGEYTQLTAGDKAREGRVLVLDPRGFGCQYDPLEGVATEDELYNSAKLLLYEPREGDGIAFTQRATKMLTLLLLAAREREHRPLPFVAQMADLGLNSAARIINSISPVIARRLLDGQYNPQKDYDENKYLSSSWESLTARLFPLLTEKVVRCFSGSDFTPRDIITSKEPITLYLRWSEGELLAKAPLVRLIWESIIKGMIDTYDDLQGRGCYPVLALLDELGRTRIPSIPDHATTVCGRNISLAMAFQSDSQLNAVYGKHGADILRGNMDTQIFYRPLDQDTADNLERRLGYTSGWAASESARDGNPTGTGKSEQRVPLLTAREIMQMGDDAIIGFHRNLPPFKARRMDWRLFPEFRDRQQVPPPPVAALPAIEQSLTDMGEQTLPIGASWQLSPDLIRRGRPVHAANGFAKKGT